MSKNNQVVLEDVKIGFKNFSGKPDEYNKTGGDRNFTLFLSEADGQELEVMGYNVKFKEYEDSVSARLKVKYSDTIRPPKVILVKDFNGETTLTPISPDAIHVLDNMEIDSVDITISPYDYQIQSKVGVIEGRAAYVDVMYCNVKLDPFEAKYNKQVPDNDSPF